MRENIPDIRLVEPEGTYFAWLDCSSLGLDSRRLNDIIINKAGLWLDSGHVFGRASEQYQRIVMASPRTLLEQALTQLRDALKEEGII